MDRELVSCVPSLSCSLISVAHHSLSVLPARLAPAVFFPGPDFIWFHSPPALWFSARARISFSAHLAFWPRCASAGFLSARSVRSPRKSGACTSCAFDFVFLASEFVFGFASPVTPPWIRAAVLDFVGLVTMCLAHQQIDFCHANFNCHWFWSPKAFLFPLFCWQGFFVCAHCIVLVTVLLSCSPRCWIFLCDLVSGWPRQRLLIYRFGFLIRACGTFFGGCAEIIGWNACKIVERLIYILLSVNSCRWKSVLFLSRRIRRLKFF
jgi:hypothetical protein